MVAEEVEGFAVQRVRAGLRGDVYRSGRSHILREIQGGLADLEFVDRAGRNVRGGRAHSLVADVHAIHVDARRAAEAAAERNRGVTAFGGIEVLSVLNLDAGFELREIKEVASIDRKVLDLRGGEHALHRGLLGVHLHQSNPVLQ